MSLVPQDTGMFHLPLCSLPLPSDERLIFVGISLVYPVDKMRAHGVVKTIWIFTGTLTLLTVFLTFRLPDINEPDPITLVKLTHTDEGPDVDAVANVEERDDAVERTALLTTS